MEFRKGSEFSFRELYGKYIQILDKEQAESLVKPMELEDGEVFRQIDCDMEVNSIFVYCYIDHHAGMSFEVLTVGLYEDGINRIHERNDFKSMIKLRKDMFNNLDACVLEDDSYFDENYGEYMSDHYKFYTHPQLERIRTLQAIDSIRDDMFPDDILVNFLKRMQNEDMWLRLERMWVRLERMDDDLPIINGEEGEFPLLYGTLLNQPNLDLGVDMGDEVRVSIIRYDDGEVVAWYNPYTVFDTLDQILGW